MRSWSARGRANNETSGLGRNAIGAAAPQPPHTFEEAEERFYDRYGMRLVSALLGGPVPEPTTVEEWMQLATAVKRVLDTRAEGRLAVKK